MNSYAGPDVSLEETAICIVDEAIEIGKGCLHLHGGMGVTEELFVGPALKRLNFLRGHVLLDKVAA